MKLLALETSAKSASVAILADGEVVGSSFVCTGLTHSRTLLPMVDRLLEHAGLSLDTLDGIAVAAGPGSFTGLRIGVATVKGLAWALELPVLGVSTLEAMATPLAHLQGRILCAMDARRNQIYQALFLAQDGKLERLCQDRAIGLAEVAAELTASADSSPLWIVGDGAKLCSDYLQAQGIPCQLAPTHLRMQSAVGVGLVAQEQPLETWVEAQQLTPQYLRLSQAERERQERLQA